MIEGLQVENEQPNGKVFYHPAVLTVNGSSKFNDTNISFREINDFWSLPQNVTFNSQPRAEGTNPSDGVLHPGDVALFSLNLNPKKGENAKPGSYYNNIGRIGSPNGADPIASQREQTTTGQSAPQSGGSWASAGAAPTGNKWDLKDERIAKAQALNLLSEVLLSGDTVNAPKIIEAMGFANAEEAIDAVAHGWNDLRQGSGVTFPYAAEDEAVEEPAADSDLMAAAVEAGVEVVTEDVETLEW